MKLALITGAHGFVGRHLAKELQSHGFHVCGIGHGIWNELEQSSWGVNFWFNGDVNKSNLQYVQSTFGTPDIIFHLAGGSSVAPSFQKPDADFERSVLSSFELLEWARLSVPDVPLVLASSAAVYGSSHNREILESDVLTPYSPYGAHKRIAEELFTSYGQNFGLNVAIVRLFSVYGAELRKQLLWDACSRLANDSSRLTLGGSGKEVRDWFHVLDAVLLLQLAAENACPDGFIVNGGTGVSISVRQVAEQLCAAWGAGTQIEFNGKSRAGDPQSLVADIRLASTLGFSPKMSWLDGVSDYVSWFRQSNLKVII